MRNGKNLRLSAMMSLVTVNTTHDEAFKKLGFWLLSEFLMDPVSRVVAGADKCGGKSLRAERGGQADIWLVRSSHAASSHGILTN